MKEVLAFLGVLVNPKRLRCAATLADHPLVHRQKANFTIHHAFKLFPDQVCIILNTIEAMEQGRLLMRLLGYGNYLNSKLCNGKAGAFSCSDMMTETYKGAQACKLGAASSAHYKSESGPSSTTSQ